MSTLSENCSVDEFKKWATEFVSVNLTNLSPTFTFSDAVKATIGRLIIEVLDGPNTVDRLLALTLARILSRDQASIEVLRTPEALTCFIRRAKLSEVPRSLEAAVEVPTGLSATQEDYEEVVEALKVLSNLALQSDIAVERLCADALPEAILNRTRAYEPASGPTRAVHYFDMRLLFLLTAKDATARSRLANRGLALACLLDGLEALLAAETEEELSGEMVDGVCEYLKVFFNLSCNERSGDCDEAEPEFARLVALLVRLLLRPCRPEKRADDILQHTANLLTAVPGRACTGLLLSRTAASKETNCIEEYDLSLIERLLQRLERIVTARDDDWRIQLIALTNGLSNACRHVRLVRKFCRQRVLPPLTTADLRKLPEEGNTLRNRLCALLTSPNRSVKQGVAFFLFVLCKENVSRAVKYTGYGNFSGFLADVGLMGGGRSGDSAALYSSESSDSETEDYEQMREQINPVTGRWERPKPNPMEGMSEERKEYEACRLMEHIDKLQRSGVIQPGIIDDDGRVRPARHVLELVEQVNEQQERLRNATSRSSDSDVD